MLSFAAAQGCGSSTGGGIGGTGIAQGVITDFGSIVVNDLRFDIDSADIVVNGSSGSVADLRPGMVVTVSGTFDEVAGTGIAEEIRFDSLLRGAVDSVDSTAGVVTVFGQELSVSTSTVFQGTSLDTLNPGTVIEVSGLADGDGAVVVTRVAAVTDGASATIHGRIQDLDRQAQVFRIRRHTIKFGAASIGEVPPGGLSNGQIARVTTRGLDGVGDVVADTVESRGSDLNLVPGLRLRIDGFITEAADSGFVLNDQVVVRTTSATEIDNGGVPGRPGVGARVLVTGSFSLTLNLVADRIAVVPNPASGGAQVGGR